MSLPPLVGITAGSDPKREEYYILRWDYVRSLEAAGGMPVILAPGGVAEPPKLLERLHGLIVSGGADIDPRYYGEERHETVTRVSAARDAFEYQMIREALVRGIPIFGICRGMQMLNVALGGSLIQDIPSEVGTTVTHNDPDLPRQAIAHEVSVKEGSRLHRYLGGTRFPVNSFHHQSARRFGAGLVPVAWADDGVVEGIEMPDSPQAVFGVQWHPEAFWSQGETFVSLFRELVADARRVEREGRQPVNIEELIPAL